MKTFRNLWMALVAVLACVCYSCGSEYDIPTTPTPDGPEKPEVQKMVTVKLNVEDIVSVQEMPMGSRTTEYNDLYLIEIQDKTTIYAYGLFDLSKDIEVKLPEGGEFWFRGVAVKDGKNKIYCSPEGLYAPPFAGKFTNKFTTELQENYSFRPNLFILKDGDTYKETRIAKDLEVYLLYSNFDSAEDTYKVSDNPTTEISLSPTRFFYIGTEFTAEDLEGGKLIVSFSAVGDDNKTYTSDAIEIAKEKTPVFNTFSFDEQFTNNIMNRSVELQLHMTWIKADGTEETLPNTDAKINVKNGYKYNININVGNTSKAAINIDEISTPTFDDYHTEKWTIDGGTATKEEKQQ